MIPKAAARKAGAVYMLSCRSKISMVTPFSPMNDRNACSATIDKDMHILNKHTHTTFFLLFLLIYILYTYHNINNM